MNCANRGADQNFGWLAILLQGNTNLKYLLVILCTVWSQIMLLRQILDNFSDLVVIVLLILVCYDAKESLLVTGKGILSHYIFELKNSLWLYDISYWKNKIVFRNYKNTMVLKQSVTLSPNPATASVSAEYLTCGTSCTSHGRPRSSRALRSRPRTCEPRSRSDCLACTCTSITESTWRTGPWRSCTMWASTRPY